MLFSVVVPTHHRLVQLERLLSSLERQSLPREHFEVIVVPSPLDKSLNWLKEYAQRTPLQLVVHIPFPDPYEGKSASYKRNSGVTRARGEWIAFTDDDCVADEHWLASVTRLIESKDLHGIEGFTRIPDDGETTLTGHGLQRLSEPGGYQTCNMFYRKATFQQLGGFDLNFPFYLEDTDLAWTFIDSGRHITFSDTTIVDHPVPPPEVKRVIDNAVRVRKIPYLYRKHPDQFSMSDFRPLSRSQWAYLFLYTGFIYSMIVRPTPQTFLTMAGVLLLFHGAYLFKLLHGCRFDAKEFGELFVYLLAAPPIALFQLIRGNIEQRTFVLF